MNGDDDTAQPRSEENADEASMECDPINDSKSGVLAAVGDFGFQETNSGTSLAIAQVESRASILPLEVDLDDIEEADLDKNQNQKLQGADKDEKSKRKEKQKDKEERLAISLVPDSKAMMLCICFQPVLKTFSFVERKRYKLLKEDCWRITLLRVLMNLRKWLEALQIAALSGLSIWRSCSAWLILRKPGPLLRGNFPILLCASFKKKGNAMQERDTTDYICWDLYYIK